MGCSSELSRLTETSSIGECSSTSLVTSARPTHAANSPVPKRPLQVSSPNGRSSQYPTRPLHAKSPNTQSLKGKCSSHRPFIKKGLSPPTTTTHTTTDKENKQSLVQNISLEGGLPTPIKKSTPLTSRIPSACNTSHDFDGFDELLVLPRVSLSPAPSVARSDTADSQESATSKCSQGSKKRRRKAEEQVLALYLYINLHL